MGTTATISRMTAQDANARNRSQVHFEIAVFDAWDFQPKGWGVRVYLAPRFAGEPQEDVHVITICCHISMISGKFSPRLQVSVFCSELNPQSRVLCSVKEASLFSKYSFCVQ